MTALVDFGPVRFERIGMSSVAMFRVILMTSVLYQCPGRTDDNCM
jgi:hypothetical protein